MVLLNVELLMNTFLEENKKEISIDDILNIEINNNSKEFSFNPFDRIIIKIGFANWRTAFYEREDDTYYYFVSMESKPKNFCRILPYNDKTKHLLGTNKDYEE